VTASARLLRLRLLLVLVLVLRRGRYESTLRSSDRGADGIARSTTEGNGVRCSYAGDVRQ
jgi:hypothetical protein